MIAKDSGRDRMERPDPNTVLTDVSASPDLCMHFSSVTNVQTRMMMLSSEAEHAVGLPADRVLITSIFPFNGTLNTDSNRSACGELNCASACCEVHGTSTRKQRR